MQCTTCGHENRDGSAFCSYCGEHLNSSTSNTESSEVGRRCPACGSDCTPDARYCFSCGKALKAFKASPQSVLSPEQASLQALRELDLPWAQQALAEPTDPHREVEDWSVEPTVMYDPTPETVPPSPSPMATASATRTPAAPKPAAPASIASPAAGLTTQAAPPQRAIKKRIETRNLVLGMMLGLLLLGGGASFWAYQSISDTAPSAPVPAVSAQTPDSSPPSDPPNQDDALASAPLDDVPRIDTEGDLATAATPPVTETAPALPVAAVVPRGSREEAIAGQGRPASSQPNTRPTARPAASATASSRQTENWLGALRQDLNECAQLGFLARIACREKARWKYCNDRWDSVPECAVNARNTP